MTYSAEAIQKRILGLVKQGTTIRGEMESLSRRYQGLTTKMQEVNGRLAELQDQHKEMFPAEWEPFFTALNKGTLTRPAPQPPGEEAPRG
jgi:hypothetical protein